MMCLLEGFFELKENLLNITLGLGVGNAIC